MNDTVGAVLLLLSGLALLSWGQAVRWRERAKARAAGGGTAKARR